MHACVGDRAARADVEDAIAGERVERDLVESDGPRVEVVSFDSLATRTDLDHQRITPAEYADRIEARQVGIARRMIS